MAVLPLVVALLYIFLPGHPGLPFSGLPVGLLEAAAVAALVTAVAWSRPAAAGLPVAWTPIVTLCFAAAVKVTLASAWFPSGWLATYYANASLAPPDEQSTDPPPAAVLRFARFGTRIDSLHPGEPPDQSLAGIAAGGRVGVEFHAIGSRVGVGV